MKHKVIFANDAACVLLFFMKKSFIFYQYYKLKVPAVGLPLKWFTPRPYLHIDLDHTVWHNDLVFVYELSGCEFKSCSCQLYLI